MQRATEEPHDLGRKVRGPEEILHFEDLRVGDRFEAAPRVTLTSGLAAAHHMIIGSRLRLALDAPLAQAVTGEDGTIASPALVWDVAIGQSTHVTLNAIANLFYRGLAFRRLPRIGDTLGTVTTVVGLARAEPKAGRPPRGKAMLRIRTTDQSGRTVLDFHRCALLPARRTEPEAPQGTLHVPEPPLDVTALSAPVDGWRLDACSDRPGALAFDDLSPGQRWAAFGGDVVTSAPELARMTLNLARIHQDRTLAQGERLVYGGHVVGLALAQASRALPSLVTILAWQECSHLGPVREGDTLHSDLTVEACLPRDEGGGFALLRSRVRHVGERDLPAEVLDWRFVGLLP